MILHKKAFFVASTGQHVGKTTSCLGLISGLKKHYEKVGFMKPIGQEHIKTSEGAIVDKDVALFQDVYNLRDRYADMSPVLFSRGFTRDYIDGKIREEDLLDKVLQSFDTLTKNNDVVVVEGTGHVGVGSIVNLNNAKVAKALGTDLILIGSGGLGSSFDALVLNKVLCEKEGVNLAGVILNRVLPKKRELILNYFEKALKRWDIPLLGCIPFDPFLSNPSINDYANLFGAQFISGEKHRFRHFQHMRLVATSASVYRTLIVPSQLIITPASREDIILTTLSKHWDAKIRESENDLETGLILTGSHPPRKKIISDLQKADLPCFYVDKSSLDTMQEITSFTAKIRKEDTLKVKEATKLVESHIDFEKLIDCVHLPKRG